MCPEGLDILRTLGRSWPPFFDDLDKDPEGALQTFFDLGYRYLQVSPPRAFLWFDESRRHDLIADVLIYLSEDDFRRLRKYQDQGTSFMGWLRCAANNKAIDIWKKEKRIREVEGPRPELPRGVSAPGSRDPHDAVLAKQVHNIINSFENPLCRVLLIWRLLFEYSNKEISLMLGWSSDRNSEVGDKYRHCRLTLIKRLKEAGIDAASYKN